MTYAGNELSPEARCSPIKMHEHRGLACSDSPLVRTENQLEFLSVSPNDSPRSAGFALLLHLFSTRPAGTVSQGTEDTRGCL